MKRILKSIAKKLFPAPYAHLDPNKKQLIDFACQEFGMCAFADLGAVWNVDGGYTFYAMDSYKIDSAVIVNSDLTPAVLERQKRYPNLDIIKGNFGQSNIRDKIGKVEGVFFFDTLLHQVNPDWDEILRMCADVAKIILIFNQQYINFDKTTRLLDLGRDAYFRNVPHSANEEPYKTYFRDLDAIDPDYKRPYRDIHAIWQWGIVDADLIGRMSELGFKMQFYKNCESWPQLQNVENHAFVFCKSRSAAR